MNEIQRRAEILLKRAGLKSLAISIVDEILLMIIIQPYFDEYIIDFYLDVRNEITRNKRYA